MIRISRHQETGYCLHTSVGSLLCVERDGQRTLTLALHSEGVVDLDRASLGDLIEALWRAREWLQWGTAPHLAPPVAVLGLRRALRHCEEHLPNFVSDMNVVKSAISALINASVAKSTRKLVE